ncbi:MAG: carbohydrate ABC transporter permease, partial [Clostridiales bacterium]|nr:carbohydrate ABC transporter permease [Clostridiales bacterium]
IEEYYAFPPRFFVKNPTFENFKMVFELAGNLWVPFSRYIFNSVFVSVGGTVIYAIVASMAAYPLAKARFPGKALISILVVFALLFQGDAITLPRYIILAGLGTINTYWAVILPVMAGTMGVFLMQQFLTASIPDATLEAARIDGASEYSVFFRIVMPSAKPAWLTVIIFTFQALWNSNPQTYIYSENLKLLPSVLSTIASGGITRAGAGSAVSVIMMIPPILIFLYSQSSVMQTMAHSGLK